MTAQLASRLVQQRWGGAFAAAAGLHVLGALAVLAIVRPIGQPEPDSIMVVELPPLPAPSAAAVEQPAEPDPPQLVEPVRPPVSQIEAPRVNLPLPKEAVTVPPKPMQAVAPSAAIPTPAPAPAPVSPSPAAAVRTAAPSAEQSVGDDPKARRQEADYFAILSAHLRRNKTYPAEARKARQQGVVTIRFTVDRQGNVSGESIKRSSGHDLLDSATLQLLRRVSPLPPMPASMKKSSVTLSLPIDYSLTTK